MDDEGVLDVWAAEWLAANPYISAQLEELLPEVLELGRSPVGAPPTREVAHVTDEVVDNVPIRIYQGDGPPTGLVVYFHGGGFVIGSIGLMDNVARELAHGSGAVVVSVEYRLAPEHPYPAALDDCETVTRWALANAGRFGLLPASVAIAGESAGGNLCAGLTLRLREASDISLAGQVLIYPAVAGSIGTFPSREAFDGVVLNHATTSLYWQAYCGGQDLNRDACAAPLWAESLKGLPHRSRRARRM
jgi:acetyl esterase